MIVDGIELHNFGPYRGRHVLDLGATHYAITATTDEARGRSNWLGKTTLAAAIPFALYGWHRWSREDGLITEGEDEARVGLRVGGCVVTRSRRRGQSTQFTVDGAKGASAQAYLDKLLGLVEEDFHNTCHFRQKHMARFVIATPAERSRIVGAWLALAPLERCAKRAQADLAAVLDKRTRLAAEVDYARRELTAIAGENADAVAFVALAEAQLAECRTALSAAQAEEQRARIVLERAAPLFQDARDAERQAAVFQEMADFTTRTHCPNPVDVVPPDSGRALLAECDARVGRAQATLALLVAPAHGDFDGRCPVAPGFECPARVAINGRRGETTFAYDKARHALADEQEAASAHRARLRRVEQAVLERQRYDARIAAFEREVATLAPAAQRHAQRLAGGEPLAALVQADVNARAYASQCTAAVDAMVRLLERAKTASAKFTEAQAHLAAIEPSITALRAAAWVYGRNGAQRTIAEGALGGIQDAANASLAGMGVGLSMAVSWSREAEGLAATCDDCGTPFPSSTRVKSCTRCGAARGEKRLERLDLDLSSVSGAAEDLAGVAFQLAASSWLRQRRGAPWASAILDEPVGALDEAHRRAFGRQAAMVLGAHGFVQSFVIAHHADVVDALPGRIEIAWNKGTPAVRAV